MRKSTTLLRVITLQEMWKKKFVDLTTLTSWWTTFVTQMMLMQREQCQKSIKCHHEHSVTTLSQRHFRLHRMKTTTLVTFVRQMVWFWTRFLSMLTIEERRIKKLTTERIATKLKDQSIKIQRTTKYTLFVTLKRLIDRFQKTRTKKRRLLRLEHDLVTYQVIFTERVNKRRHEKIHKKIKNINERNSNNRLKT